MKKFGKISLLILSLLPYITIAVCIIAVLTGVAKPIDTGRYRVDNVFLSALPVAMFAAIPFQWVFYITNVFRNTTVGKNEKALWAYFLLAGHIIAFPFYWYFHIWKDNDKNKNAVIPESPAVTSRKESASYYKSKRSKIILLAASLLPFVFMLLAALILSHISLFPLVYVCGILFYVSIIVLIVVYIVDVYRNSDLTSSQRLLWAVMFVLGTMMVFLIYWYTYIWKSPNLPPDTRSPN